MNNDDQKLVKMKTKKYRRHASNLRIGKPTEALLEKQQTLRNIKHNYMKQYQNILGKVKSKELGIHAENKLRKMDTRLDVRDTESLESKEEPETLKLVDTANNSQQTQVFQQHSRQSIL